MFSFVYYATIAAVATSALAQMPGGWSPVNVSTISAQYYAAVTNPQSYLNAATPRICATSLDAATQQVVAGLNYKVAVHGCPAPSELATGPGCSCAVPTQSYTVSLYQTLEKAIFVEAVQAAAPASDGLVGGFTKPAPATEADKQLYFDAVSTDNHFASASIPRVCPTAYLTVATQVVSGTNYRFVVQGCAIPASPINDVVDCDCSSVSLYGVEVYQDLKRNLQVTRAAKLA